MAVQESNILDLISQWNIRLVYGTQSDDYKCALSECISELQDILASQEAELDILNETIAKYPLDEIREYFDSLEADIQQSTLEANEPAA